MESDYLTQLVVINIIVMVIINTSLLALFRDHHGALKTTVRKNSVTAKRPF